MFKLSESIYGANSIIPIDFMAGIVKENIVVRLFYRCIFEEAIDFLVDPY